MIFNDQTQNRWAYEVRLTSQGESRFQWMGGAFYEDVYDWWDYGATVPDMVHTTQAWTTRRIMRLLLRRYDTLYPRRETTITSMCSKRRSGRRRCSAK